MSERRPGDKAVTTPSLAGVYDYLLGGVDNYAADRRLAETFLAQWPALAENARINRAWMTRVVRTLAERGVHQFLDIGSGLPTADNVHQVAQRIRPDARVLYVDNDQSLPGSVHDGREVIGKGPTHESRSSVRQSQHGIAG